jgi:hypothetical protein
MKQLIQLAKRCPLMEPQDTVIDPILSHLTSILTTYFPIIRFKYLLQSSTRQAGAVATLVYRLVFEKSPVRISTDLKVHYGVITSPNPRIPAPHLLPVNLLLIKTHETNSILYQPKNDNPELINWHTQTFKHKLFEK